MNNFGYNMRRKVAFWMAMLLIGTTLYHSGLTTRAAQGDYTISVKNTHGDELDGSNLSLTTSGGDAVPLNSLGNGQWNAELDSEEEYSYVAEAEGYRTENGTLGLTDYDFDVDINLKKLVELRFAEDSVVICDGNHFTNLLSGDMPGQSVEYRSSNEDIALVNSSTGEVTRVTPGRVTITASVDENDHYCAAEKSYDIVFRTDTVMSFANAVINAKIGERNISNPVTVENRTDKVPRYESDDPSVSVDANGIITVSDDIRIPYGQTQKTVTVTAYMDASDDGVYKEASASYTVKISRKISSNSLNYVNSYSTQNMYVGQTYEWRGNGGNSTGTYEYESSNENVVKLVDTQGTLMAVSSGDAVVIVTKNADTIFEKQIAEFGIRVFDVPAEEDVFEIVGTQTVSGGDWYTGDVQVKAKTDNGYKLGVAPNYNGTWNDILNVTAPGENTLQFYAKNANIQTITDQYSKTIKIDKVFDALEVSLVENKYLYNNDVAISVQAEDQTSGIGAVQYELYKGLNSAGTMEASPVRFGSDMIVYTSGSNSCNGTFNIPSSVENGDYTVIVTVQDVAGNVLTDSVEFRVNTDRPEISIDFGNDTYTRINNNRGYYSGIRMAEVTIVCDTETFDANVATQTILSQSLTVADVEGNAVSNENITISAWQTVEGATDFEDKHVATITFLQEGNYTWNPHYTDKAGNANNAVNYGASQTPQMFTVDYSNPTGTVSIKDLGTWGELPANISFGLTSNVTKEMSVVSFDAISPIAKVMFYKTTDERPKTVQDLQSIEKWEELSAYKTNANERLVVYIRIEDYSGNVNYIGTNGVIFDNSAPLINLILPGSSNGVYSGDVAVGVEVTEPDVDNVMSGLRSVDYTVTNGGEVTAQGNLYTFTTENPAVNNLQGKITSSFVVNAAKNNSNDVNITVRAVDNAGNQYIVGKSIMIDVTKPVVSVTYNNNNGDSSFGKYTYFKEERVATISVRERNFDPANVTVSVKNEDGDAQPVVGSWSSTGSDSGDDTLHTIKVSFNNDGRYTFDVSVADKAGNRSEGVNYGTSVAPQEFVIDRTNPVITIEYDNADATNGNYYKADRTALITINEHNFETSRVALKLDEQGQNNISLSTWQSRGNVHTASILFEDDAYYSWSIEYTDMAGNVAEQVPNQSFYVDKTLPELVISGIRNQSANNSEGNIGFVLSCTDTNFDVFEPELSVVIKDNDSFVSRKIEGKVTKIANGQEYAIENLPEDGIYTLHCVALDKAGNSYELVKFIDANGELLEEFTVEENRLAEFSINRNGSVFEVDEKTLDTINKYYVQTVNGAIQIIEINADVLNDYRVELNGNVLQEGKDYTVKTEGGGDSWYRYVYTINKELFEQEGDYSVVVCSTDKADTIAYSDVKNVSISFVVDKTAPTITLSGLESKGRYQTEEQLVTMLPMDDGGKLRRVQVVVSDSEGLPLCDDAGNDISVRFNMAEEELEQYLTENAGQISFTIPEGYDMSVKIIADDYSTDENGITNECVLIYDAITVSSNAFVILFANKALLFSVIGAVGVTAVGTSVFCVKRRGKKKGLKTR